MKIKINKILIGYLLILSGISYAANENTFIGSSSRPNKIINNSAGRLTLSTEYNSISQDFRQKFIIIHYTAINKESSIRALVEKDVSSHFLISDQYGDPVYYLVDEDKRSWHSGLSSWKTRTNLNDSSLGIEIVNNGQINGEFVPYKDFQIEQVAVLVKYLSDKYQIPPENILGHSDIAPQRKSDPGALFPWKELYEKYGLGMWYDEYIKQSYENENANNFYNISSYDIQNEFKKFGYGIELTGILDKQTENVVKAFQHRFRPSLYDGIVDLETYAILKALNQKYNNK